MVANICGHVRWANCAAYIGCLHLSNFFLIIYHSVCFCSGEIVLSTSGVHTGVFAEGENLCICTAPITFYCDLHAIITALAIP